MRSTRGMKARLTVTAVAAAVVAGGGLATTVTTAAPAEAATGSIRVITHNVAKKPEALQKVLALADSAKSPGPEVVFLQEVCQSMLKQLDGKGPREFHIRRTNQGDCSDGVIGEVVMLNQRGAKGQGNSVTLLEEPDKGQSYGLACLNFTYRKKSTRACSTHLPSGREADRAALRLTMTRAIKDKARLWNAQNPVLVGGDFNSLPTDREMAQMYALGTKARGDFVELNQTAGTGNEARAGLFTIGRVKKNTDRKYDYVFSWAAKTARQGGSVKTQFTPSNHRMMYGAFPLR
ncbi:endonuclease/exonuclease/phosphatase family protein [Arthrobacter sp. NEB 688]|uniref:endonuclease/exonuclease/phosphatase family protein n=1 Tax=Arthrobacter sp. NEB 688 TaxID=904039 RepID=UPI0015654CAB|nr:endonuclease/exonuclease/phosphatase family protein [Arthrobacter sp. NEB 688]QKE83810.1 hypothetical protein HL663_07575 [Arthrobacter sp. NEB 688]